MKAEPNGDGWRGRLVLAGALLGVHVACAPLLALFVFMLAMSGWSPYAARSALWSLVAFIGLEGAVAYGAARIAGIARWSVGCGIGAAVGSAAFIATVAEGWLPMGEGKGGLLGILDNPGLALAALGLFTIAGVQIGVSVPWRGRRTT